MAQLISAPGGGGLALCDLVTTSLSSSQLNFGIDRCFCWERVQQSARYFGGVVFGLALWATFLVPFVGGFCVLRSLSFKDGVWNVFIVPSVPQLLMYGGAFELAVSANQPVL